MQNSQIGPNSKPQLDFDYIFDSIRKYLVDVINLETGVVDKQSIIEEIRDKKSLSGGNAWMLICSIVIACIGLSQNSGAVIIGAMLISPLMSPILGIGLGVGINDNETLYKSLLHLGIAVLISLVTSIIYFWLTPFSDITTEIEARTAPTFLDAIVAIFGGIAGIVSIVRKDISTTIPGVAIATALMPPLCVAGYGLANANFGIASKSFYLFFLNTFFVAFSTYVIVKFVDFPVRKYVNERVKKRNFLILFTITVMAVVPSFFIFRGVLKELNEKRKTENFISQAFGQNRLYLDSYEILKTDSLNWLVLKVYGNKINSSYVNEYNELLSNVGLPETQVKIIPTSEVDIHSLSLLESKVLDMEKITDELDFAAKKQEENQKIIQELSSDYKSVAIDSAQFSDLSDEMEGLFPKLKEIGLSKSKITNFDSTYTNIPVFMVKWQTGLSRTFRNSQESKINRFVQERLDLDTLILVRF